MPGPGQAKVKAIQTKLNSPETEMQAGLRTNNCAKLKMQTANLKNQPATVPVPVPLKIDSPPLYRWLSPGALVSMTSIVLNNH